MMKIDLDKYFRQSAARSVAEKLLTGKPYTRMELVEGTGVSVSTVNRVVEVLTEAGAKIHRDTDGHQAVFRCVAVNKPAVPFPGINDEVRIVGGYMVGDSTLIDLEVGKSRYRGTMVGLSKMVPLGKRGVVKGIMLVEEGLADIQVKTDGDTSLMRLDSVQNVTGE